MSDVNRDELNITVSPRSSITIDLTTPKMANGGVVDYSQKTYNKPQINSVELDGNVSFDDLGITALLDEKVDKEEGKGLSTNDYTNEDKQKLYSIIDGANLIEEVQVNGDTVDIVNKVVNIEVPTNVSELNNDSGFLTEHQNLDDYATKEYVDDAISGGESSTVEPDWDENDSTSPNYIKNRPFYTRDPEYVTFFEEQEVTFNSQGMQGIVYWSPSNIYYPLIDELLIPDSSVRVKIDDDIYYFPVVADGSGFTVGGKNPGDSSVLELKFGMGYGKIQTTPPQISIYYIMIAGEKDETHTVSIAVESTIIEKLQDKYLNGKLITVGGEQGSEIFNDSNNESSGTCSHAEGGDTKATAPYSHSEGRYTTAYGRYSHAEGYNTTAQYDSAHAEGGYIFATINKNYITLTGDANTNKYTVNNYMLSNIDKPKSLYGYVISYNNADYTVIGEETSDGVVTSVSFRNTLSEETPLTNVKCALIPFSYAEASASHSEGAYNVSRGDASHVEGFANRTTEKGSHAEGGGTFASGIFSHTEGNSTNASNYASHAEGYQTTASGGYSHAEGHSTVASNYRSHAEGYQTTASGQGSHSEGYDTTASGQGSHAEGFNSIASGTYSHAEGQYTTASGAFSHADGSFTTAQRRSQHVFGEYNVLDTDGSISSKGKYIEIVGNGTGEYSRNNARTLDWDGNETIAGSLTIGGETGGATLTAAQLFKLLALIE